jgi:PucR C-terminal helix-turn-helix domain/GGDEF-like domain
VAVRINALSDSAEVADPAYREGLTAAVSAAVDYGLATIERGERLAPAVPPVLFVQARMAARNGVGLDTVLRRYFAGYGLLSEFIVQESERAGIARDAGLHPLLRGQAALFDRLIAAVSEEYNRELADRPGSSEHRRAYLVERLLDGELLDSSELAYDFDAHHLGLIVSRPGTPAAIRGLAAALDCRLLLVPRPDGTLWAWLAARRPLDPAELLHRHGPDLPPTFALALGEPGRGHSGWRLTHRQAAAALPIALRGPQRVVRYGDVALLAAVLRDDLLASSLRQLYLAPLERERDGGETFRRTLHAYFAAGGNVSSAAAQLEVDRKTVMARLGAVEQFLGRSIHTCAPELETALRLHDAGPVVPRSR